MSEQNKRAASMIVTGEHKIGPVKSRVSAVALLTMRRKWNPGHGAGQPKAEPYYRQVETHR